MRVLVDDIILQKILTPQEREIPGPSRKQKGKNVVQSAIYDVQVSGAEVWQNGKFHEYLRTSTYDPALGHPVPDPDTANDPDGLQHRLRTDTVFDDVMVNPIAHDELEDLEQSDINLGGFRV